MVYLALGVVVVVGLYGLLIVRAGSRPTPAPPGDRDTGPMELGDREDVEMADGYSAHYAEWCRVEMKVKK